jgi:hypothetical protein
MKNLFYVCLIAILSLGSTGFTTVEEMKSSGSEASQRNCFDEALAAWDFAEENFPIDSGHGFADMTYVNCINHGGSPGSQEPVVIIAD